MAIPVILPTIAPNAAAPPTEAAAADKVRRPSIPVITAVQPYVAIRPRHQDRERDRRQAAFEAWLGLHKGQVCWIGANATMSRRLNVIRKRYQSAEEGANLELDIEA